MAYLSSLFLLLYTILVTKIYKYIIYIDLRRNNFKFLPVTCWLQNVTLLRLAYA